MKKILLFIILFVRELMNGEVFAAGTKQNLKIRLKVVDPLRVRLEL